MVVDSALLLLLSFLLAGLLSLILNARNISRLVAGSRFGQVIKTAIVGIPLPLCSCSVLPVAYQLRKAGVSRAGTASFLISTPESGVDSILLTYSLMDPLMTIARPIAAFATALTAGAVEASVREAPAVPSLPVESASCDDGCCSCSGEKTPAKEPLPGRLWSAVKYGYLDLMADLAVYLVVGYLLAGLVVAVFGGELLALPAWLRAGWGGYFGAIVVGLPLYICATSSTPLAAALIVAGFSPGAVLVFLLVGPATNVASLAVVSKILKGWAVVRYLGSIVVVAVLCGLAVDWIYRHFDLPVMFRAGSHEHAAWFDVVSGIVLGTMLLWMLSRKLIRRLAS